jgi:hypothetical protein
MKGVTLTLPSPEGRGLSTKLWHVTDQEGRLLSSNLGRSLRTIAAPRHTIFDAHTGLMVSAHTASPSRIVFAMLPKWYLKLTRLTS